MTGQQSAGSMEGLATSLFREMGLRGPTFQEIHTSNLTPVLILVSWIFYLPIAHRKALLDACRIQASIRLNTHLATIFTALTPVNVTFPTSMGFQSCVIFPDNLSQLFENIHPFPALCSFLSYFVRAEGTVHVQEFLEQKQIGIDKELQAALFYQTNEQILDYRASLFGMGNLNLHPQLDTMKYRTRSLIEKGLRQIAQHFSSVSCRPLLPRYNARKNVSYETCENYYLAMGIDPEQAFSMHKSVTTLDLLKLYYRTGEMVQGCLEMRLAWFFNDLKPRIYYCMGGSDFWHGIFIQEIANLFCEMLPSTNPFSRFSVSRVGSLTYDDLLITYDYSSFTTSLGELKYFLHWLSEAVGDTVVSVLDVVDGVRDLSLRSILRTYNEMVNRHQAFSIERFAEAEERYHLHQGRSGSLGVKGNIVFSTTLHGLALSEITGTPDDDCCVGDDALSKVRAWIISIFITCVNNLGVINPDKFTMIRRPLEDESYTTTQYKFLKRPLYVDHEGIPHLGRLDFFPSICDVLFPLGDGIHTASPGYDQYNVARSFAMQWGRYLTIHTRTDEGTVLCVEEDLTYILSGIRLCYQKLGLPLHGGIPGDHMQIDRMTTRTITFFCPPADTISVFYEHWLEVLLFRFIGRTYTTPVTVGGTIPPPLSVTEGETFVASSDVAYLQLLVDLGVLEKHVYTREEIFDEAAMEALLERFQNGRSTEPLLCEYTVVEEPPSWWYDVVKFDYVESLVEDPQEAADRVSSIMSGSVV